MIKYSEKDCIYLHKIPVVVLKNLYPEFSAIFTKLFSFAEERSCRSLWKLLAICIVFKMRVLMSLYVIAIISIHAIIKVIIKQHDSDCIRLFTQVHETHDISLSILVLAFINRLPGKIIRLLVNKCRQYKTEDDQRLVTDLTAETSEWKRIHHHYSD